MWLMQRHGVGLPVGQQVSFLVDVVGLSWMAMLLLRLASSKILKPSKRIGAMVIGILALSACATSLVVRINVGYAFNFWSVVPTIAIGLPMALAMGALIERRESTKRNS